LTDNKTVLTAYRRNINGSIITLWVLFLAGLIVIIYSLSVGWLLFATAVFIFLVALGFLPINRLLIIEDVIDIETYSGYGFKRKDIRIDRHSPVKAELVVNGDIDQVPDDDSPFGFAVFLIPFLYKKYALWIKTAENKKITIVRLTKDEFHRLEEVKSAGKTMLFG